MNALPRGAEDFNLVEEWAAMASAAEKAEEYLAKAKEAEELGAKARDPEVKRCWEVMAKSYRDLAKHQALISKHESER